LDVHTLLIASLAGLLGWQCVLLATLASIFAAREGMMPPHAQLEKLTVERGLVFGLAMTAIGVALIAVVIVQWWRVNFGPLDYPFTMRFVVPGVTFVAIGFQTAMAALMAGVLKMHRRDPGTTALNSQH
jgi:hypothetical protein